MVCCNPASLQSVFFWVRIELRSKPVLGFQQFCLKILNMFGMSLVEQYLYSLPEYRTELHRRNFIEICSFNGLLATRKVIGMKFCFLPPVYSTCDVYRLSLIRKTWCIFYIDPGSIWLILIRENWFVERHYHNKPINRHFCWLICYKMLYNCFMIICDQISMKALEVYMFSYPDQTTLWHIGYILLISG